MARFFPPDFSNQLKIPFLFCDIRYKNTKDEFLTGFLSYTSFRPPMYLR